MATGILGLGSSGSVDLSSELIEKLKTAESTSVLDPITADIEETEAEQAALEEISEKILEFLDLIDNFDLYTSETNIFDEISATTSGSSVSFDAADTSKLSPGTITVNVSQLAQKDVYQSNTISDTTSEIGSGTISITVGDETFDFNTDGMTYEDLVTQMNYTTKIDAALEQVGDDSYRLVIKSSESGLENAISISQTDIDLGLEEEDNHMLTAQNMIATVDGIEYNLSSNKITMESGLIITANDEGKSSITMERDDSSIVESIEEMATQYNDLVDLVNSYILGDDEESAVISDSSTIKTMMNSIKEILFGSYGLEDEENLFAYGISFDSSGYMIVDSTELSTAITNNYDDVKELFVGYAEKEGIGTRLKTYLDSLDGLDGLLTSFSDKLSDRLDELNDEYDEESDRLDEKYEAMATQFAEYTVLITEMENSFASLKLIIDGDSDS